MSQRFENKIALVTGAAQGIGKATAERLAREGALVIVADRAEEEAREVVEVIESAGGRAQAAIHDLEVREEVEAMFAGIRSEFGRLDISVHNVGGTIWIKPFSEYKPEEIIAEVNRSLWPTLWCCHSVLPIMLEQQSGSIINVGTNATRGIYRVPYAAAKGGVEAITKTLALEVAPHGIRVNCVAPGGVDVGPRKIPRNPKKQSRAEKAWLKETYERSIRETPLGRLGTPDEISDTICFMASDEGSYITGQILYVAGGGIG